jgi:hypothetical protein
MKSSRDNSKDACCTNFPPLDAHVQGLIAALVTIADSLEAAMSPAVVNARGLPGCTFERVAGELWRCRFCWSA